MTPPQWWSARIRALMKRFDLSYDDLIGIRFAINVSIATTIVWSTLQRIGDTNPIWAVASMVAASEPDPREARRLFQSRLVNVLVGCAVGLGMLLTGGRGDWMMAGGLGVTVLLSTYLVRVKTMWRQAPITAAIVIATGITSSSAQTGMQQGLHKVAEVLFGCLVGLLVSWLMSHLWVRPPVEGAASV